MRLAKIFIEPIRFAIQREGNFFRSFSEYWYHTYKRNKWMLDFTRFFRDYRNIKIDRPVFLLGVHGGGLTLLSRIIRRHNDFVSVSGNCKYWTGADEMQVVLGTVLPAEFAGINHKIPHGCRLRKPTHWLYAANEFVSYYRKTEKDYTAELAEKFKKIIRWMISRNALDKERARFIDKSQTFALRIPLINKILEDSNPKFILVTRDPYAMCYRTAMKVPVAYRKLGITSFNECLKFAAQHWANSMKYALMDGEGMENFMIVKFEDFLSRPEENLKRICDFIGIDFDEDLVPRPEHKIPFGTKNYAKWYPLQPDINSKHLKNLKEEDIGIIDSYVSEYARKFGYEKPQVEQ